MAGERRLLRLSGWSKERRVVVLRRPLRSNEAEAESVEEEVQTKGGQTVDLGSAGVDLPGSAI